jgi:uridine kinase
VRTGYGCRDAERYPGGAAAAPAPDLMFDDVAHAVRFALSYRRLVAPLIEAIGKGASRSPLIVGICGRSRAGKSVVAHALVRALTEAGEHPLHVRLDDWIMPAAERRPDDTGELRNRADRLPAIVAALRSGQRITAPGYDSATRTPGPPVTYEPAGHRLIVVEGVFAAHRSARAEIDLAAFVEVPESVQRARFDALYRWKRFDQAAIEGLWRERIADEWAAIDAQREHCDMVITTAADMA